MTDPSMHQNDGILSTGRLRYWDGGPKQAPVILLLHSAFSDAAFSWSPVWAGARRQEPGDRARHAGLWRLAGPSTG